MLRRVPSIKWRCRLDPSYALHVDTLAFLLQVTLSIFLRCQIPDHRTGPLLVVELDVAVDELVLLSEAWLFQTQQRVVQSFYLERTVEALHRRVVIAVCRT